MRAGVSLSSANPNRACPLPLAGDRNGYTWGPVAAAAAPSARMENDHAEGRGGPGNPNRSRDHFRWDERHHQPHTDMSKWQKFWASRTDAAQFVRLLARNVRQAGPVVRRYRTLLAQAPPLHPVAADEFGVAVSPTRATWGRYLEHVRDLGVGALLIRIPSWAPEPVFDLREELASLAGEGIRLTFTLAQDRSIVNDPRRWGAFARQVATLFAPLSPAFQVGHAINRKKWGIWHPDEYVRLLEATAPVREEFPGCRWLGPPVIDFEYYFTTNYLVARRPFDFDGIAALLYVDRRGSPDAVQYRHFDLRRKILLLRAVVQASHHPDAPIHLTEFNWPLHGAGTHSPAGAHVQTDEAGQARYLVLYYLTAASTGHVTSSFWWQLAARGYGLVDDETWTERRSYRAFRHLLARTRGWEVSRLSTADGPLRGFLLQRGGELGAVVYAPGAPCALDPAIAPLEARDIVGDEIDPARLSIGPDPVYLSLGVADPAGVRARLGDPTNPVR
jgi:hypothetical protein